MSHSGDPLQSVCKTAANEHHDGNDQDVVECMDPEHSCATCKKRIEENLSSLHTSSSEANDIIQAWGSDRKAPEQISAALACTVQCKNKYYTCADDCIKLLGLNGPEISDHVTCILITKHIRAKMKELFAKAKTKTKPKFTERNYMIIRQRIDAIVMEHTEHGEESALKHVNSVLNQLLKRVLSRAETLTLAKKIEESVDTLMKIMVDINVLIRTFVEKVPEAIVMGSSIIEDLPFVPLQQNITTVTDTLPEHVIIRNINCVPNVKSKLAKV
jgi:hypothetical protein